MKNNFTIGVGYSEVEIKNCSKYDLHYMCIESGIIYPIHKKNKKTGIFEMKFKISKSKKN